MGRPRKETLGPVSTRERILDTATALFARDGLDGVSIRDITKSLGLNEASLYNHFASKQELLQAILQRLDDRLLVPSFALLPPEAFSSPEALDPAEFLIQGGRRFFARAGAETLMTWRILMSAQYRYESARDSVRLRLLEAPVPFFRQFVEEYQKRGRFRADVASETAARVIASLFFEHSFRANLEAAWGQDTHESFRTLEASLRLFCASLTAPLGSQ